MGDLQDRDTCVYRAKLAEQAERYDEMVKNITLVAKMGKELTIEERNLLSVAYKNVIGARRQSWRIIAGIEAKEERKGTDTTTTRTYRKQIEEELASLCRDIITLLDEHLLPSAESDESKVFLHKMQGDYHRYMAEFAEGGEKTTASNMSNESYKKATEIAEKNLPPTHPIRLGLALNYSVFFYEISSDSSQACELAKKAFDAAIAELDTLNEESYKDSTLIMQLLRDNLTLWTADSRADGDKDEDLRVEDVQE